MSLNSLSIKAPNFTPIQTEKKAIQPIVLLVDDHYSVDSKLVRFLEHRACQLVDTDNGQDAIRLAGQIPPDMLVVDLDVPLLYELVAARQIVKRARLGAIPVLIVTHDDTIDPAPIIELGVRMNEFVSPLSDFEQLESFFDRFSKCLDPAS